MLKPERLARRQNITDAEKCLQKVRDSGNRVDLRSVRCLAALLDTGLSFLQGRFENGTCEPPLNNCVITCVI